MNTDIKFIYDNHHILDENLDTQYRQILYVKLLKNWKTKAIDAFSKYKDYIEINIQINDDNCYKCCSDNNINTIISIAEVNTNGLIIETQSTYFLIWNDLYDDYNIFKDQITEWIINNNNILSLRYVYGLQYMCNNKYIKFIVPENLYQQNHNGCCIL